MNTTIYKCFIASPSDTEKERKICDKVFDEINKNLGEVYKFRIESLKWENDVRPTFSTESQNVINNQIGNDYDLFVGIMYKKFGSPTTKAGSGTEEEFNNAYDRYSIDKNSVDIMVYFNNESTNLNEIDPVEFAKVKEFKNKVSSYGGLYCDYNGCDDFEDKIRNHFNKFFIDKYKIPDNKDVPISTKDGVLLILEKRLNDSLCMFSDQPVIWEEPTLSKSNEILHNPDDNYNNRVPLKELIDNPQSYIIAAPPRFGLTSLAHYLVLQAYKENHTWIYLDAQKEKIEKIHKSVEKEVKIFGKNLSDIECVVLDAWNTYDNGSTKKIKKSFRFI